MTSLSCFWHVYPSVHPFSASGFIQDQKQTKKDRPDILFSSNRFQLLLGGFRAISKPEEINIISAACSGFTWGSPTSWTLPVTIQPGFVLEASRSDANTSWKIIWFCWLHQIVPSSACCCTSHRVYTLSVWLRIYGYNGTETDSRALAVKVILPTFANDHNLSAHQNSHRRKRPTLFQQAFKTHEMQTTLHDQKCIPVAHPY